jgi:nitrite reductase/ring-hydroxylating ferredoxin subunit
MTSRFVIAAKAADIRPGDLVAVDVAGTRIALANVQGRFYAIGDTCTHEQCSLAGDGTLDGHIVTCGCHGAQFDVTDGTVLAPPAPEPVPAYPTRVDEGNVMVQV